MKVFALCAFAEIDDGEGSGTVVLALYETRQTAEQALSKLNEDGRHHRGYVSAMEVRTKIGDIYYY